MRTAESCHSAHVSVAPCCPTVRSTTSSRRSRAALSSSIESESVIPKARTYTHTVDGGDKAFEAWVGRRLGVLQNRLALILVLRTASPGLVASAVATAFLAGLLPIALILASGALSEQIQMVVRNGA